MKHRLITEATEKGFKSEFWFQEAVSLCSKEGTCYYLWMCELQKWFIDEKRILVEISYNFMDDDLGYGANVMTDIDNIKRLRWLGLGITGTWYKTYELALEKGLSEALKLINK